MMRCGGGRGGGGGGGGITGVTWGAPARSGSCWSPEAPMDEGEEPSFHGCTSGPHRLHQNDTIPTDCEAEAMLVFLDDDTALYKTCCLRGVRGLAVVGRGLAFRC